MELKSCIGFASPFENYVTLYPLFSCHKQPYYMNLHEVYTNNDVYKRLTVLEGIKEHALLLNPDASRIPRLLGSTLNRFSS